MALRPLRLCGYLFLTMVAVLLPFNLNGETKAPGLPNIDDMYKQIASFDFRMDDVVNLSEPELKLYLENSRNDNKLNSLLNRPISIKALWTVAFVRNPDLESMRNMVRSRAEMFPQTMYVDALAAQYRSFIQNIQTRTSSGGMSEGVELLYPGPGVLSFNGRIARLEVEMALEDYGMKLRDIAAELYSMAAERESIGRSIAVMSETIDVISVFEASLKSRFTTDRAMYPELSRLRAERSRMINERNSMKRMETSVLSEINRYLARDTAAPLGKVDFPSSKNLAISPKFVAEALDRQQELRIQGITIEILKNLISLKNRATFSSLSPGFIYPKFSNGSENGMRETGPMGASAPDPLQPYRRGFSGMVDTSPRIEFGQQAVYLRELSKRVDAEVHKRSDLANSLKAALNSAFTEYENARQGAETEKSGVIPVLKHGVDSASAGYRTGNVSFLEWMEIFMKMLEARMAAIRYDLAAQKAISKLMMLQGSANFQ